VGSPASLNLIVRRQIYVSAPTSHDSAAAQALFRRRVFNGWHKPHVFGFAFFRFGVAGRPACCGNFNRSCRGAVRVALCAMPSVQRCVGAMVDGSPARRLVVALAARLLRMSRVWICLPRFGVSNPSNNRFERTRGIVFGEPRKGSMIGIKQFRLRSAQPRVAQPHR